MPDPWERLVRHRTTLEILEGQPETERDWEARGSVEYHRACIRHLERITHGLPPIVKKKTRGK